MTRLSSPYKGLNAFEDSELDALLFFGREREREIVVANLIASRLTVLYGPSGVGKSSLLRAAVARSLRELPRSRSWSSSRAGTTIRPARSRRRSRRPAGRAANGSAVAALETRAIGAGRLPDPRPVRGVLPVPRRRRGHGVVRRGAAGGAGRAARVNVLISLREDSLAKLDRFTGRIPGCSRTRCGWIDSTARPPAQRSCDRSNASRSSPARRSRSSPGSSSGCSTRSARADRAGARRLGAVEADGTVRASRRRTSSSSCSGSGTRSAARAPTYCAVETLDRSAARSTSSRSTSRGRWPSSARSRRTSPPALQPPRHALGHEDRA